MSNWPPPIVRHADDALAAMRALTCVTSSGAIPPPVVGHVLHRLALHAGSLDLVLVQLGVGLVDSLSAYEVFEDDGAEPLTNITRGAMLIADAAERASLLSTDLLGARAAIENQGFRTRPAAGRPPVFPPPDKPHGPTR